MTIKTQSLQILDFGSIVKKCHIPKKDHPRGSYSQTSFGFKGFPGKERQGWARGQEDKVWGGG